VTTDPHLPPVVEKVPPSAPRVPKIKTDRDLAPPPATAPTAPAVPRPPGAPKGPVDASGAPSSQRVPIANPAPASAPKVAAARPAGALPFKPTPSAPFQPMRPGAIPQSAPRVPVAAPAPPAAASPDGLPPPEEFSQEAALPLTKFCSSCNTRYPTDFLLCPRDATPLVDDQAHAEDPLVGKLLGETYQIVRVIGEGGMGKVYEARHLRLRDKRFAVKVLHQEMARQQELVVRFQREAEASSKIDHENVVDVFDVHKTVDGIPYLVAEYLEGEELGDVLDKQTRLDVRTSVAIIRQVCRALAAAHARGVVHRDMKPENVFVIQRDGRPFVKVLDFGISRVDSGETNLTKTGMIMGTPSYMAPEQARGEVVDARADVYAVGAVLYHMVTGRRPFWSEDPTTIISMVLTQEPPRPRSLEDGVPEGVEFVIQKAMAKQARERYQNMAELDAALAAFDDGGRGALSPHPEAVIGVSAQPNVLAGIAAAAGSSVAPPAFETGGAQLARPTIWLLSTGLALWLIGGFVDALAGVVRAAHGGEVTVTESVLLLVGTLFAASTPGVLYFLHVRRNVWPNSVRAMQLASDLRRTAAGAFASYGALAVGGRLVANVFTRTSPSLASGWWDLALFLTSLVVAAVAGGLSVMARRARRNQNA
jgi:serine/threonine-protein kinase